MNHPISKSDFSGLCPLALCFDGDPVTVVGHDPWGPPVRGGGGGGIGDDTFLSLDDPPAYGGEGFTPPGNPTTDPTEEQVPTLTTTLTVPTTVTPTVAEACVQGLAGFIDGAIPFGDPFRAGGVYDAQTPGLSISTGIGEQVRDFSVGVLASGAVLANVAWQANAGARAGSGAWHFVSNNRFVRIGLTSMGYGAKTPAVRFGNSSTGRFLTHVDLMPRFFSKPTVRLAKKCLK
jgi:hypothetical protein